MAFHHEIFSTKIVIHHRQTFSMEDIRVNYIHKFPLSRLSHFASTMPHALSYLIYILLSWKMFASECSFPGTVEELPRWCFTDQFTHQHLSSFVNRYHILTISITFFFLSIRPNKKIIELTSTFTVFWANSCKK